MGIKDSLKFSVSLSKKILRRSLAAMLTFSLLFNVISNIKVHAGTAVAHIPLEQLQQMPFDRVQERAKVLESQLEGQTKGTGEYTQTVQDLTEASQVLIDKKNVETTELNMQIDEQQKKIDVLKNEIEIQSDKLKQALEAIYIAGGDVAFLNLFFKSAGVKDFVDTADTVKVINDSYTETLQSLEDEKAELDKQQQVLEIRKQELTQVLKNLEEQRQKFEKFRSENAEAIDKIRQERIKAVYGGALSEQFDINKLGKRGRYIWPLPGFIWISSSFGDGRGHTGIDIAGSGVEGAPIVAAADGVITHAGVSDGGYGIYVEINHGDGYSTLYAHQSRSIVEVGQMVKRGQVIGYVGNTGHSFGAHLHFETRFNNNPYDPQIEV